MTFVASRREPSLGSVAALLACLTPTFSACGGAALPPSSPVANAGAPPAPDAVWVNLQPERPDERWSLLGKDDKVICALPCARWLSPEGGEYLAYEKPGTSALVSAGLPKELGPPGGRAVGVAREERRARGLSAGLVVGGISLGIVGSIVFFALEGRDSTSPDVALAGGVGAGAALIGAGIYVSTVTHQADVVVRAADRSSRATFALGPGYMEVAGAPSSGLRVVLTPMGASGTF